MFHSEWLPQRDALKVLGIGRTTLWRLRRDGVIRPVHMYRSGTGPKAKLWLNVEAVRLAMRVASQG